MSYFQEKLKLCASVQSGLEAVTKRELASLGISCEGAINGKIPFTGNINEIAKANMFLRTASRIYVEIGSFKALSFDELYDGILAINWEDILLKNSGVTVLARSIKSKLEAVPSIQSITKKAIVIRLQKAWGISRLNDIETNPVIEVSIFEDMVTVYLDTSGESLHKRGYRSLVGMAPLKETLAAGIILLSFWNQDRVLFDPFTGSGTIPIEAALIGTNTAPGILRNFSYEQFPNGKDAKKEILLEATSLKKDVPLRIYGYDIDSRAIGLSNKHAAAAGVASKIHFQASDMRTFSSRFKHGVIITNPPYGERLKGDIDSLYSDFFKLFNNLDSWSAYVLSSYKDTEKMFGRKADKTRKLYNSEIECKLFQYFGPPPKSQKPIV